MINKNRVSQQKIRKVVLNRKETETNVPEYYTYIDENGNEQKYAGVISKVSSNLIGKLIATHKVQLDFHPGVATVVGEKEHWTYIGDDGNNHIYDGEVMFDETSSSYVGIVKKYVMNNTLIDIFEEK